MAQLVWHIAFDLKLWGFIPAIFWEEIVGLDSQNPYCPAQSCLVCKKKWVHPLQAAWAAFLGGRSSP